jgi:hypothetical protein
VSFVGSSQARSKSDLEKDARGARRSKIGGASVYCRTVFLVVFPFSLERTFYYNSKKTSLEELDVRAKGTLDNWRKMRNIKTVMMDKSGENRDRDFRKD